jgi:hypothetical protein
MVMPPRIDQNLFQNITASLGSNIGISNGTANCAVRWHLKSMSTVLSISTEQLFLVHTVSAPPQHQRLCPKNSKNLGSTTKTSSGTVVCAGKWQPTSTSPAIVTCRGQPILNGMASVARLKSNRAQTSTGSLGLSTETQVIFSVFCAVLMQLTSTSTALSTYFARRIQDRMALAVT